VGVKKKSYRSLTQVLFFKHPSREGGGGGRTARVKIVPIARQEKEKSKGGTSFPVGVKKDITKVLGLRPGKGGKTHP